MNTPTTATEALRQCELLWKELARTGSDAKTSIAVEVLGYYPLLGCPACEYDAFQSGFSCTHCPIDAWRSSSETANCECDESPYNDWRRAASLEARQAAALRLLDLVRASEAYHEN